MTWARPINSTDNQLHSIAVVVFGHRYIARCHADWPDTAIESHDDPPVSRCCVDCVRELVTAAIGGVR